jgi:hypothetical protein
MTNARKKAKQIKKAKARKDKAKALRHRSSLTKKEDDGDSDGDEDGATTVDRQDHKPGPKQATSKPASFTAAKIHRTQGK